MAVTLGKRKRRVAVRGDNDQSSNEEADARALFQRAFEAKFKPLEQNEKLEKATQQVDPNDAEGDGTGSDWDGFSEDESNVHVVEHAVVGDALDDDARAEMKAFMVRVHDPRTHCAMY